MKVILTQDVKNLGKKGETKEVAEGYGRNFLIPRNLAKIATEGGIREVQVRKEKEREKEREVQEKLRKVSEKLKNKKFILRVKSRGEKLFGSVSRREVAEIIKKDRIEVEEKNVILKNPIKKTGDYPVEIDLGCGIKTKINLEVLGE